MTYKLLASCLALIVTSCTTSDPKYLPSVSGAAAASGAAGSNGANGTNGVNGKSTLAKVVPVAAGQGGCVNGGQELQLGQDADANGTLDAAEVTTSQYICNGVAGATGGQAGTANGAQYLGSTALPPGPTGGFSINTKGGDGKVSAANGANGGNVLLEITQTTLGGHVKVFATGNNTNETAMPPAPPAQMPLGPEHMLVSSAVTITAKTSAAAIAAGNSPVTFFTINDDAYPGRVYLKRSGALIQVTDMTITNTGSLVVEANTLTYATLSIPGIIVSDGAINTTAGTGTQLLIGCSSYFGSVSSSISAPAKPLVLTVSNILQNAGVISTTNFGAAASITLNSLYGLIHNEGAIRANGTGLGGAPGSPVTLQASRAIYNSGQINSAGGGNIAGNGGAGANISLLVQPLPNNAGQPQIRNTGMLSANGSSCSTASCVGGKGGDIMLAAKGGAVATNYIAIANGASLLTFGGDSTNAVPGPGGKGGKITILSDDLGAAAAMGNVVTMAGSISVSGNLTSAGGNGSPGNTGGDVTITLSPRIAFGQEIVLLGYEYRADSLSYHQGINTSGGNGGATSANGGNGGNITMKNSGSHGGGVVNSAALLSTGGSAGVQAGHGGKLLMSSSSGASAADVGAGEIVINSGKITLNGGSGTGVSSIGGYGGEFKLIGAAKVECHLSSFIDPAVNWGVSASDGGGDRMSNGGLPLGNNSILSSGAGPVTNEASILVSGGSTSGAGPASAASPGQSVTLIGTVVTNSGNISSNGGSSSNMIGYGNDGGNITLLSSSGTTTNTGVLSATGGTSPSRVTSKGVISIDGNAFLP